MFTEFFRTTRERRDRHRVLIAGLHRRSSSRALSGILLDWLVIVAAGAVSEYAQSWPIYLLSVLVITSRMNALDLCWLHEAVHYNLFPNKHWHWKLEFLYSLPFFTTLKIARDTHLKHHKTYINECEDPLAGYGYWSINDAQWSGIGYRIWIWFIRPLCGFHTYTNIRDTILDLLDNRRDAARVLIFWGFTVGVAIGIGKLRWIGAYWLVPFLLIRPPLYFWQDMAQHFGTWKSPSRDVRGRLYEVLLAPHARGAYHSLHHLYPGIPWFRLAQASELLIDDEQTDIAGGFIELSRQILASPPASSESERSSLSLT